MKSKPVILPLWKGKERGGNHGTVNPSMVKERREKQTGYRQAYPAPNHVIF